MNQPIQPGDRAPKFDLPDSDGGRSRLADYAGRTLVLFFYPRDHTPTCTREALDFSSLAQEFVQSGCGLLGVSRDSVESHQGFISENGLTVKLASDENGAACEAYGVWKQKSLYGRTFMGIERSTFLVGPSGKIIRIWRKVRTPGHAAAVLDAVRE
jgi:thioredoxin-dependent peroxiredoxin